MNTWDVIDDLINSIELAIESSSTEANTKHWATHNILHVVRDYAVNRYGNDE